MTLDIPDEIHARLKARAKAEGTTMRAVVIRALENLLITKQSDVSGKSLPSY